MSAVPGSNKKDGESVHILLVEAEPGEARMYVQEIVTAEPQFRVSSTATLAETLTMLKESQPDILLLDLGLPGGEGLEGLRQVLKAFPETPAIVLAERAEGDLVQRALEQGAVDFLMKGHIDRRTVLRAVQCALWRRETLSSPYPHGRDELTGLFNRHGFERMAAKHFEQAQKQGGTLVLLGADVDNLAAINRTYGPADSHRALQAITQLLQKSFRRTDLLGRTSEEGFAALLIDAVEPSAPVLRQRLERRLAALNQSARQPYQISLSIGVQFWNPAEDGTLEELFHAAEADLQRIREEKRRGQRLSSNTTLPPQHRVCGSGAAGEMREAQTTSGIAGERIGPQQIRVLIVEHDRGDIELEVRELRRAGMQVEYEAVETREQFREKILRGSFDAVLADYRLPKWNGLEALEELRQLGKDIPFLLVSGTLGEEAAVECIKRGVSDYVLKGHLSRLPIALERALEEKSLRDKHAHATAALRDSEASFRLLFADNPLPMWVYDRETLRFLQVNDTAVAHYGYSREEFLGMRLTDIRPPEDVPKLLRYLKAHPESMGTTGPWRHRRRDGQIFEVQVSQHLLPFAGRDAVLAVLVDVTEQRSAEKALRESEARAREQFAELDLLYRTAPVGIAVFDSQFRYLRINEQLARINGFPADKHIGRRLHEILPELAGHVEPMLRKVFERGELILDLEMAVTTPAQPGVERYWLTNYFPLCAADGTVFAASVIVLEITDRKRAEQALQLSEARNRDLVENTTYGILRATADGHFLDVNPALVRMLGFTDEEELHSQRALQDVFRYPEQAAAFLGSCREKGSLSGVETEWRRKEGANIIVRLAGRMAGPEKEPDVLEVIAEDVTELRAMEKQLRQVQKFEAVGQLAGGVAHDFNNVMGAILGWAEIGMEQARKEPRLVEHFAKIREQADRAAALTRQLLAFARQQVLQPRAVDLNGVVSSLLSFLEKVIGRDIELKVIPAPALDLVRADPTQIEQVLMNLCLNARDAMPDGGRLLIETEVVEIDEAYCRYYSYASVGRYVVLSVSDTGIGMDAATRERIFEPFFTTKGLGKGTGLGLATVYGIIKQHGGFIHVYSEPGQGSLFRVYVPASSAAASPTKEKAASPAFATPSPRGTETILLAEDHDGIREMARQTLANLGYRVLSATNGEEALLICENETPALAILDVVMPRLNGPAAHQKLQARFPGLAVIFTTGYTAEQAALEKHLQIGGTVLQKPYSPTTLGRMVRELLDRVALAVKPDD